MLRTPTKECYGLMADLYSNNIRFSQPLQYHHAQKMIFSVSVPRITSVPVSVPRITSVPRIILNASQRHKPVHYFVGVLNNRPAWRKRGFSIIDQHGENFHEKHWPPQRMLQRFLFFHVFKLNSSVILTLGRMVTCSKFGTEYQTTP